VEAFQRKVIPELDLIRSRVESKEWKKEVTRLRVALHDESRAHEETLNMLRVMGSDLAAEREAHAEEKRHANEWVKIIHNNQERRHWKKKHVGDPLDCEVPECVEMLEIRAFHDARRASEGGEA
jgi:phosphotransferase system IIB component